LDGGLLRFEGRPGLIGERFRTIGVSSGDLRVRAVEQRERLAELHDLALLAGPTAVLLRFCLRTFGRYVTDGTRGGGGCERDE
jgi:hypothetical protein